MKPSLQNNNDINSEIEIQPIGETALDKPLPSMAEDGIHAGFPSPAQDYMSRCIDLNSEQGVDRSGR